MNDLQTLNDKVNDRAVYGVNQSMLEKDKTLTADKNAGVLDKPTDGVNESELRLLDEQTAESEWDTDKKRESESREEVLPVRIGLRGGMLLRLTTEELSCVSLTGKSLLWARGCWPGPGAWRGEDGPRLPAPGLVTGGTGILGLCGRTLSVRAMILRTAPGDSVPVRGKKESQPYRVGDMPCTEHRGVTQTAQAGQRAVTETETATCCTIHVTTQTVSKTTSHTKGGLSHKQKWTFTQTENEARKQINLQTLNLLHDKHTETEDIEHEMNFKADKTFHNPRKETLSKVRLSE